MGKVSKTHKAELPLEPVPTNRPECAHDRAFRLAKEGRDIHLPVSFDHPKHGRAAGTLLRMRLLPYCTRTGLPDGIMTVEGRSGASIEVEMLASYAIIYHTFEEADANVAKYTS